MNKWWMRYYKQDEANDGTQGGAGGGSGEGGENKGGDEGGEPKGGDGNPGKTQISDTEAALLKENLQKKTKITDLQTKLTQATESLKAFEGIDPVAVKALLAKQKADEDKLLEDKGDFDRLKQRMSEEHTTVVTGLNDQIKELQDQLNSKNGTVNELTVGAQFNNSPYIKEKLILTPNKAKALYESHFELVDGQVVGFDKPRGAASRTAFVDATGASLAFDAVMTKLIDSDPEKDSLLRSTIKAGANSGGQPNTKVNLQKDAGGEKSSVDKIANGLKGLKPS